MKKIIVMMIVLGGQLALGMDVPQGVIRVGGPSVEAMNMKNSELLRAAEAGNLSQVRALLDHGVAANVRMLGVGGVTPLYAAVSYRRIEVARLLLHRGADIHARDLNGLTPLVLASQQGNFEMVRLLLNYGANINETFRGGTALMWAASEGHNEVVRLLLDRGANINAVDSLGWTALIEAAFRAHFGTVLELLAFIPLVERKAIQKNIRSSLNDFKPKAEIINKLAQEEMPHVMARARLLAAAQANDGATARGIALRTDANRRAKNLPIENYQTVINLLDLDSPISQATIRKQVEANIRWIAANLLPEQPQSWYQRAWSSVKDTARSYWKWIAGGTAVTVGGYMAWKKMKSK